MLPKDTVDGMFDREILSDDSTDAKVKEHLKRVSWAKSESVKPTPMDIGLLTYSPLAGGLLGGKIEKGETGRRSFSPKNESETLSSYESLCHKTGVSPADLALAWVANQPLITAPIVGPRTMAQLESSVKAIEIKLEKDVLDELDELFPGPGGPAPEAYSW